LKQTKFLDFFLHSACFSLTDTFYRLRRVSVCTENQTRGFSFCSSHIRPNYLPQLYAHCFSKPTAFFLESTAVFWLWISIFIDFFPCISCRCGNQILELYTLSISLFFGSNSVLLLLLLFYLIYFISDKKNFLFFVIEYFLEIFGTGMILQNRGGINFLGEIVWRKYSSQSA